MQPPETRYDDESRRSLSRARGWLARGMGYYGIWVVLIGIDSVDLLVGLAAAAVATWASLVLMPRDTLGLRWSRLPAYAIRFVRLSVISGVDIAWRAFHPRLPLKPGKVLYPASQAQGASRSTFAAVTSVLPGTLALDDRNEGLHYHCLDTDQPVESQLAEEEAAFTRAVTGEPGKTRE